MREKNRSRCFEDEHMIFRMTGNVGDDLLQETENLAEKKTVQAVHLQMVKDSEIIYGNKKMGNPQDAAELVTDFLGAVDRECLVVCAVDIKMKPVYIQVVAMGSVKQCPVSIPDVFKAAILSNAVNIILFHNHLSGDVSPSKADRLTTEKVKQAGELLGISLLDHIILGGNGVFYSFREHEECFVRQE